MPIVRSSSLATAPAATRAAVSRALARSSTSRASSKPYFCIPARSAWPGRTWVSGAAVAPGRRRHLGVPLVAALPLRVGDLDGDRRPQRAPVADAADQRQLVGLEALPRAATEAEAAAGQFPLDVLDGDRQAGRQPFEDDDEPLAVGLSRSQEPQHRRNANARPTRRGERVRPRRRRASRATSGRSAEPQLLLQGGLVDEHAEPVERARPGVAGGAQQGGVERVVDEVGDEVLGVQERRVERDLVGAEADRRGVDDQLGGAELGIGVLGGSPRGQRGEGDDVGDLARASG